MNIYVLILHTFVFGTSFSLEGLDEFLGAAPFFLAIWGVPVTFLLLTVCCLGSCFVLGMLLLLLLTK
jgi:hypothetical protein